MGDFLGKLFVPLDQLPGLYDLPSWNDANGSWMLPLGPNIMDVQVGGLSQLIFLAAVYGYILFVASGMISDGSELLSVFVEREKTYCAGCCPRPLRLAGCAPSSLALRAVFAGC